MPLFDRMQSIQRGLKARQAYIDAQPVRVAEWTGRLNQLYDRLDDYLAGETSQGLCAVARTATDAKSEDLGVYKEPNFVIMIERVAYVSSTARRMTNANPDTVDLRGPDRKWHARLKHIPGPSGALEWFITAHSDEIYLDQVPGAWLTAGAYQNAIERFFPFWQG